MPYSVENFKSKAALKRAVDAGIVVSVYQPGPFGPDVADGTVMLEGPHYPAPHTWYATVEVVDRVVVKVKR